MTRVSVITVCRNPGPIVMEAIRSVQMQDYPDVEHVVIDGASTDGTADCIRGLMRRGDVLVSEPDAGIYAAMNKGLALATGDVVAILNADDRYAAPDVLSRVVAEFERTGADAVIGDVTYFRPGTPGTSVRRYGGRGFTPARIGWGFAPAHAATILTREAYRKVGPYSTDYPIAGDFEYAARAFVTHGQRYVYLPLVMVKMQLGGASTSRAGRKTVNRELLTACRRNGVPTNPLKLGCRYLTKAFQLLSRA